MTIWQIKHPQKPRIQASAVFLLVKRMGPLVAPWTKLELKAQGFWELTYPGTAESSRFWTKAFPLPCAGHTTCLPHIHQAEPTDIVNKI